MAAPLARILLSIAAVTGLLGDEVVADATDNLLVALTRAGKLSPRDMVRLTFAHHRELKQLA